MAKKAKHSLLPNIIRVPRVNKHLDFKSILGPKPYRVMGKTYNFGSNLRKLEKALPGVMSLFTQKRTDRFKDCNSFPHEKYRFKIYAIIRYGLAFGFDQKPLKKVIRLLKIYNNISVRTGSIGRIIHAIQKGMRSTLVMKGSLKLCIRIPCRKPRVDVQKVTLPEEEIWMVRDHGFSPDSDESGDY